MLKKSKVHAQQKKINHPIGNVLSLLVMLFVALIIITTIHSYAQGGEPGIFGHRLYYVASGSMSPTIPVGALIVVKETEEEEIQSKDIITFKGRDNRLVTHRVKEIIEGGQGFITRGDANNMDDPMPVTAEHLVGKVVFHIPYVGYLFGLLKPKHVINILLGAIIAVGLANMVSQRKNKIKKMKN